MPTYVCLMNLTDEGAKNMASQPANALEVRKRLEEHGFKYHALYWLHGPYDGIIIADAPSEEALMRALVANATRGRARTMTMRAYTSEEMQAIIGAAE